MTEVDWASIATADHDQAPTDDRTRSWLPQDIGPVLDGTYRPPQPTVGHRDDHVGLFYPGRVSSVASESEAGKTWLALLACLQEINAGHHVLYVDFEDDAGGVVGRLLALGAHRDDVRARFHYVRPEGKPSELDTLDLGQTLALGPTLAVVDGITEAMSMFGLELTSNNDVARFGRLLLRPLSLSGAAVVTLDHVVKAAENRGRYSLGGVHKLNGLTGVMYVLENLRPFGIGVTGKSRVRIAKDRPAQLRRHALPGGQALHWFADLVIQSHDESFAEAQLCAPTPRDDDQVAERQRITDLQAAVVGKLREVGRPLSKTEITERVTARAVDVRRALAALVDSGHVVVRSGSRGAQLHELPADIPTPSAVPTPSDPVPGRGSVTPSPVPPPLGGRGRGRGQPSTAHPVPVPRTNQPREDTDMDHEPRRMTADEHRAAVRRRAADRARAMGYRRGDDDPDPGPGAPRRAAPLPDVPPRVLRALLHRGHLTDDQAETARSLLAAAAQYVRDNPDNREDYAA